MWIRLLAAAILAATAWRDGTTKIIPDELIALLFLCGGVNVVWNGALVSALAGVAICGAPVLILAVSLRHGSIGGGDVKLCTALGFLLGPISGSLVILVALVGLSIYGLIRHAAGVPVAFAPFAFPAYIVVAFLL